MSALRPVAIALAMTCSLAFGATAAEARRSPSPMVDQINEVRRTHGLRTLQYSRSLARSASRYVRYLVRTDQFRHGSPIMASRRFSLLGEILARTAGRNVERPRTLANWLRSPSHRAVLLSSSFRYIGAARATGRSEAGEAVVWAVQFGR